MDGASVMVYTQYMYDWSGHSVNDAPAPTAVGKKGHYRLDTDLLILSYSDGTNWIPFLYGPAAISAFTNKTFDFRANTLLRHNRFGCYRPNLETGAIGEGILAGLVAIGNKGTQIGNTGGKYDIWNTRGVIDDAAGVVKLDTYTCRRNGNPLLRFAWLFPGSTANRREFKGVGAKRLINTNSNTVPLNSNESGFFFGYGAGDTTFKIFNNDATGAMPAPTDTTIAIPGIATNYILELQFSNLSSGSVTYTLYGVTSSGTVGLGVRSTVLGTGTISTRLPGATTDLYMQDLAMTANTTIQPNNIHYVEVYS